MSDVIKKYKELIGSSEAELALDGKINPTVYIFRAKNYQGLSNKQEVVVTPNSTAVSEPKDVQAIIDNIPGLDSGDVTVQISGTENEEE